jgi:hypothetical protein
MRTSIPVPPSPCLDCGKENDAATNPFGRRGPRPGDYTICMYCGAAMAFSEDLTMRPLTAEEKKQVENDPRVRKIQMARGAYNRR